MAVVACGTKADPSATPGSGSAPVAGTGSSIGATSPGEAIEAPSTVELVSAGAEPRQRLTYALAKGVKSAIELSIDVDFKAKEVGGPMPTMTMAMELGAEAVLADGKMRVRSTVTRVTAKDRPGAKFSADTVSAQGMMLEGIGVVGTLAPNGSLSDAHLDFGDKHLPPELQSQLSSLTKGFERVALALPDQPVGIGATWRTRKEVIESGAHMSSTTTIVLEKIEGSVITFARTAEVTGPDQVLQQMGVSVTMKNISGKGTGHGTLDLSRMVLVGEMVDEMHNELSGGGQSMPATMTMRQTYALKQ